MATGVRIIRGQLAPSDWQGFQPPTVFQRPESMRAWTHTFGAARNPVLLLAENAQGRALLPLAVDAAAPWPGTSGVSLFHRLHPGRRYALAMAGARLWGRLGGILRGTHCHMLGAGPCEEQDMLVAGKVPAAEIAAGLDRLRCRRLTVASIAADSPLTTLLPRLFSNVSMRQCEVMPILHTGRQALESFRKLHPNDAYKHRRLLRRGGRIEHVADPDEARRILAHAFELKRSNCLHEGKFNLFADRRYEHWLDQLVTGRLGDFVHLDALFIGTDLAACVVYFTAPNVWSMYFVVYDKAHAKQSPGTVLLWDLLERAVAAQVPVFSFLAGDEHYKERWADDVIPLFTIEAEGLLHPSQVPATLQASPETPTG